MIQQDMMNTQQPEVASQIQTEQGVVPLEYVCPVCRGHNRENCKECHGKGVIPSLQGRRLIAFLHRHMEKT
jgi:hypothetical protein